MIMKNKLCFACAILISIFLTGCSRDDGTLQTKQDEAEDEGYVCVANVKLEPGKGEEAAGQGKTFCFLGNGKAYRITNYYGEQYSDSETEVVMADSQGNTNAVQWPFDEDGYVTGAGSTAESEKFAAILKEGGGVDGTMYRLEIRGGTGQVEKTTTIDLQSFFGELGPESVAIDCNGYAHLAGEPLRDADPKYQIFSPEGETVWSKSFSQGQFWRLIMLPDGSVAMDLRKMEKEKLYQHQIIMVDVETGEESILFQYKEDDEKGVEAIRAVNRLDQEHWILIKPEGVYLCENTGEEKGCLYSFQKHGIDVFDVENISSDEAGNVSILFRNSQGLFFLHLVPAPEEVYVTEFAVPKGTQAYDAAVAEFNLKHPDRQIVIRDDYDPTQLLTKILAGDGPALIDAGLVSFRDQTEYWEPLNELYSELGLTDVLNEAAVKLGAVDGTFYGIVPDFFITTLISASQEENWNYDTFLRCLEDGKMKYMIDNAMGESNVFAACELFDGGVADSFYFEKENGEFRMRTEEFRSAMQAILAYGPGQAEIPYVEGVNEGEVLCNMVYIFKPSDLLFYHQTYGEEANVKGFPRKSGAKNQIRSSHIVVIQKAADPRDKETAQEFARMLLSKETQTAMAKGDNFQLSVRTDVFKEQVMAVEENARACPAGFSGIYLEHPDNEANYRELLEILANSIPVYDGEDPYKSILEEEFLRFFSGEQSEEALMDHLENRVRLYLNENE